MSVYPGKPGFHFKPHFILRTLLGLAFAALAFAFLAGRLDELSGASVKLANSDWRWGLASLVMEALSLTSYAVLQKRLIQTAGVTSAIMPLLLLTMATIAITDSLPGEPAFSTAYRFQQYKHLGTDDVGASWVVIAQVAASTIGLVLLLIAGLATLAANFTFYYLWAVSAVGAAVIFVAAAILFRRDLLSQTAIRILRFIKRSTGHPRTDVKEKLEASIEKLRSIEVGRMELAAIVGWALLAWIFEALCLIASFYMVAAPIPWTALTLAYGLSQIAAVAPILPGGLGLVEGSITSVLVAFGAARVPTLAAVLAYRLVEYWLMIPLGWLAFAFIAYQWRKTLRKPSTSSP